MIKDDPMWARNHLAQKMSEILPGSDPDALEASIDIIAEQAENLPNASDLFKENPEIAATMFRDLPFCITTEDGAKKVNKLMAVHVDLYMEEEQRQEFKTFLRYLLALMDN